MLFSVTLCRLDIGDGKELDLKECPRSKLRQQCIKYLGPVCVASQLQFSNTYLIMTLLKLVPNLLSFIFFLLLFLFNLVANQQERVHYEYIVVEGKITHKQTGDLLDTSKGSKGTKWIFVMSTSKRVYAGEVRGSKQEHALSCISLLIAQCYLFLKINVFPISSRKRKDFSIIQASWQGVLH